MATELERCYNSLKDNGFLFIVHGNHSIHMASYATVEGIGEPPVRDGDRCQVRLKHLDLKIEDVYWSIESIVEASKEAGFELITIHQPLGELADAQPYLDEYQLPPYSYIILRKP
ncbi:hypothetical protein [Dongshaea marina]|uniref:hypothetical protein n=1 Tax=Dongshaea marina TaxID=2047966 RepID=UPI00131EDAB3|nr:hypothetical protein [Dongshaea marina]